jgi:hypothetical protein
MLIEAGRQAEASKFDYCPKQESHRRRKRTLKMRKKKKARGTCRPNFQSSN